MIIVHSRGMLFMIQLLLCIYCHSLSLLQCCIQGPNGENIGAIVQPLPYSYLIFRAPSEAAGFLAFIVMILGCSHQKFLEIRNQTFDNSFRWQFYCHWCFFVWMYCKWLMSLLVYFCLFFICQSDVLTVDFTHFCQLCDWLLA